MDINSTTRSQIMKILSAYDASVRQAHPKCGKSLTEQHHAKTCNINAIMAKYNKTGLVDHINRHQGRYGDVSGADFQNAQNLIAEQITIFEELPAPVRAELNHDPAEYLDLVMTEEGQETLSALLNPEPDPQDPEPEKTAPTEPETTGEPVVETS